MSHIGVSIIIPVFNRELYLSQAINSILTQEFSGDIEIIISDDGSTDSSLDIAASYNDSRIRILKKPIDCTAQGASSTRNRALKIASMPYVCFLDSDDYQLPTFLKTMIDYLENTKLDFCFCRTKQLIEKNNKSMIKKWTRNCVLAADIKYPVLTRSRIVNTNSFVFHRRIFDNIGFFNEEYSNSEDIDLWIRISELYKCGFVDFYGTVRRSHEGEQLTKNKAKQIQTCTLSVYEEALKRAQNGEDKFRCYLLKFAILVQNRNNLADLGWNTFILMCKYPLSATKHLPLLFMTFIDRLFTSSND